MIYEPSKPFSAWTGPRDADLVFVGEAWGNSESQMRKPFCGESGKELFRMIAESPLVTGLEWEAQQLMDLFKYGLSWVNSREGFFASANIAYTNVFNFQPYGNKISEICIPKSELPPGYFLPPIERSPKQLFVGPQYLQEVARLEVELREVRPRLVVALGAKASWALLRETAISNIRGTVSESTLVPGLKVLPTYHPAAILRQWAWRSIIVADLYKAARERQFADIRRPSRIILYSPSFKEVLDWTEETLARQQSLHSFDTETEKGQVTMISIARARNDAIVIPFVDHSKPGWSYWASAEEEAKVWFCVECLLTASKDLWQNGVYDFQYLNAAGMRLNLDEDLMLRHHSIMPEVKKGLGFLGSLYTSEPAWKLMRTEKADTEKRDE